MGKMRPISIILGLCTVLQFCDAQNRGGIPLHSAGRNVTRYVLTHEKSKFYNLFYRMDEPIFIPKGDEGNKINYIIPQDYMVTRYKGMVSELADRFGEKDTHDIQVKPINIPDLTIPRQLGRRELFSPFIPSHRRMAAYLINIFLSIRNLEDLFSVAVYCRDRINPYMYVYALSIALLHRPDTRNLPIPSVAQIFPDKYIDGSVFSKARQEANVMSAETRIPIEIPRDYTASDLEYEHRVAYFREDLGINIFHWHWHLVYPFDGPPQIVNKDRRGELFYYIHHQVLARYNFERLSNSLGRVERLLNLHEPIKEGYFPKLDSLVASRIWPPRHSNAKLSDINREIEQLQFDLQDLERWRDRILTAIHVGEVVNERRDPIDLTEKEGIDILGNMVESSIMSVNRNLYGDLHNLGHAAIAFCHDPDGRHLETFSVMGDPTTAMRDPVFYRWHAFIDDLFQEHKNTLPRYSEEQLDYAGVRILGLEVQSQGAPRNEFITYWQQNEIDLSRGLDFAPRGPLFARFIHLTHIPFTYQIQVENDGPPKMGTVRLYIAPKFDEKGLPMLFREQAAMMVELDKFTIQMNPGRSVYQRRSDQSSVTVSFETTFRDFNRRLGPGGREEFNYCGCGWPHHMLIPKGKAEGMEAELFVMVSDYIVDRVEQPPPDIGCHQAHSYCGLFGRLYPDSRSLGYPFDRLPRDGVNTIRDFLTPNMALIDVTIRHQKRTLLSNGTTAASN